MGQTAHIDAKERPGSTKHEWHVYKGGIVWLSNMNPTGCDVEGVKEGDEQVTLSYRLTGNEYTPTWDIRVVDSFDNIEVTGIDTVYDGKPHFIDVKKNPSDKVTFFDESGQEIENEFTDAVTNKKIKVVIDRSGATETFETVVNISPKDAIADIEDKQKEEGAKDPEFTWNLSGLLPGDDVFITGSPERESGESANTYIIRAGSLTLSGSKAANYKLTVNEGILTITPRIPVMPPHSHTLALVEAKSPTCTDDGNIAHWKCTRCGKRYADENGRTPLLQSEAILEATGHTLTKINEKEPTCVDDGNITHWLCVVCEKTFSDPDGKQTVEEEELVLKAKGHDMDHVEYRAPTCTDEGNAAYWTCSTCGKAFEDAAGNAPINEKDTILSAKGHSFSEWIKSKNPTSSEYGEERRHCSECGYAESRLIAPCGSNSPAAIVPMYDESNGFDAEWSKNEHDNIPKTADFAFHIAIPAAALACVSIFICFFVRRIENH